MLGDVAVHLLVCIKQCSYVGDAAGSTAIQRPHAVCIDDCLRMDNWGFIYVFFIICEAVTFYV